MSVIFLTPAAVSYLTQFILALAITLFLINRLRSRRDRSLLLLTAFFAPITVFIGLLVFNAAFLPFPRLLTVFAENAFLGLALAALNAFAYHFPERYPQHKWEMRLVLALSLTYFFWEVGFMIFRYVSLLTQGNVFIRPPLVAYSIPVIILFAPIASLRQTLAADPRRVPWWRKLWQPEGKGVWGARNFALVFGVPVALGVINALIFFGVSLTLIHAAVSIGILVMLWLLANNYVNFIPGGVNVASRLSIITLTLFLALLGALGWLIAPSYITAYPPALRDHQTLRFTPNSAGGYVVSEADFHFENTLGEKVRAQTLDENGNHQVEFPFPF
jgi:MFS family permease